MRARKTFVFTLVLAVVAVMLVGVAVADSHSTGHEHAGCLTKGGSIANVALGPGTGEPMPGEPDPDQLE